MINRYRNNETSGFVLSLEELEKLLATGSITLKDRSLKYFTKQGSILPVITDMTPDVMEKLEKLHKNIEDIRVRVKWVVPEGKNYDIDLELEPNNETVLEDN